jgi:hypothetical protein
LLRRLCAEPEDHFAAFDRVAEVLAEHALHVQAEPIVRATLTEPNTNPSAGWLWVELRLRAHRLNNAEQLLSLPEAQELARRAWDRQLDGLGAVMTQQEAGAFRRWRLSERQFDRLLRARRAWLHRDDLLWGKVGYVLSCGGRHHQVVDWLADWADRTDIDPWMLDNLLIAYQQTGRTEQANALIEKVRQRPRHGGGLVRFDLFHALREACADNPAPGRHLLAVTLTTQLDRYETALHEFLTVALEFLPESGPPALFDRDRQDRLLETLRGVRRYQACQEIFRSIAGLISRRLGRAWPRWWAQWHLLGW